MMMKQDKDWTDVMRRALHDAELPPSEDGWERLQRKLEEAGVSAPEPRRGVWRIYGPRIAAAAAAVLICVVAGEFLLRRPDMELGKKMPDVASLMETDDSAVGLSRHPESGTLRKNLAEASGWGEAPGSEPSAGSVAATGRPGMSELLGAVAPRTGSSAELRTSGAIPEAGLSAREKRAATRTPLSAADAKSDGREEHAAGKTPMPDAADRTPASVAAGNGSSARPTVRQSRSFNRIPERRVGTVRRNASSSGTSLSLFAGGGMTGATSAPGTALRSYSAMTNDAVAIIGNGDNFSPMEHRDYDKSDFSHHLPLSFGLSVRKSFARGLSLESGLNYTLLRSEVRMRYSSEDVSQKLHFVGVPLRLNWQFVERGRFSAYVGAGGMIEKCVSAKFGSESVDESALQWSVLAALGAQYSLGNLVGIYFEPEVSYYLTDTELRTSRSDAPLTLSLRVGVRLLF